MSKYDILGDTKRHSNPEQRLQGLRNEMLKPISLIGTLAELLQDEIHSKSVKDFPSDWESWVSEIAKSSKELREILEVFTNTNVHEE